MGSDFDTLLAVYTGTAVNALTLVSSNDNCASGEVTSCATFSVTAGTTYSVQVDGVGGAKGAVSIGVTFVTTVPAPANDLFSNAVTTFPATGSKLGATLETGEPLAGTGASGSVWYRLTAPVASTSANVSRCARVCLCLWGVWGGGRMGVAPFHLSLVVVHGIGA